MVCRGSRFIITTNDNMYVVSSVKVHEGKVLFPTANASSEFDICELPADQVISIHKEDFVQSDVTEELIPLEDDTLVLAL